MSALAVATLAREGIGEIVIANRTYERGAHLARSAEVPARAIELADLRARAGRGRHRGLLHRRRSAW